MFNILYHNELIDFAIKSSGLGHLDGREQISFLGEGAWHHAYLFTDRNGEKFVIRFPKEVSIYGNNVDFDEKTMLAEYRGTELYYDAANKVRPGICPEFYHFFVVPGKTYTIETFKGETIKFAEITTKDAFNIGYQMGEFFREMNKAKNQIKGFGYLTWNGTEVEGLFQTDLSAFIKEENEEIDQDFETVTNCDKRFNAEDIKLKLKNSLASRNTKRILGIWYREKPFKRICSLGGLKRN